MTIAFRHESAVANHQRTAGLRFTTVFDDWKMNRSEMPN